MPEPTPQIPNTNVVGVGVVAFGVPVYLPFVRSHERVGRWRLESNPVFIMEALIKRLQYVRALTSKENIPFIFAAENEVVEPEAFVARIPTTVEDREELLQMIADKLSFPDYFGHNWDALTDCLRDFSWIGAYRIVLLHEGLPERLAADDLAKYIEILIWSVREWKLRDEPAHELVVVFPPDAREPIERLL